MHGKSMDELETILKGVKSVEMAAGDILGKPVFAAAAGMFKSNGKARRMAQQGRLSLNGAKVNEKRLFVADDLVDRRIPRPEAGQEEQLPLESQSLKTFRRYTPSARYSCA